MTQQTNTVAYPAKIVEEPEGGYSVTFRDVPEAYTYCDRLEDAVVTASYVLTVVFEHYREYVKHIPEPSQPQENEVLITIKRP